MKKTKQIRSCSDCRHYTVFYTKGAAAFFREKAGLCLLNQCAVSAKDHCPLCHYRPQKQIVLFTKQIDLAVENCKFLLQVFSHDDR